MLFDYETLRLIWWVLLGVLLIGFALTDGFDIGVAILLPFITKEDVERRVLINTIGPIWEGNQVWFILGGGAIFAAWPALYAVAFSGFYLAMLLVLLALILRPVAFKYRSKLDNPSWRNVWDYLLFISGIVPALIFGVAIGNVLQGVPFHFNAQLRSFYTGEFLNLLNPFALIAGLLSVTMLTMHGACFINLKTTANLKARSQQVVQNMAILSIIIFAGAGVYIYLTELIGYTINSEIPHDGPSNPLYKSVELIPMALFRNYKTYPLTTAIPFLSLISLVITALFKRSAKTALIFSGISISSIITTVGVSLYPFILPSSSHPAQSLVIWDSSSSQTTLFIMLLACIVFLPIIFAYTSWVYYVFRGKVTTEHITQNDKTSY
ncbi:MAG: cytochrome d ubiquinol oxidase subunit II [Legionellales bacterium RIFCSPHIGHO2_12_FULL_37_14]|nr:MAG: cytochrome d ubiquinol oxidase subunit II [Legionellales bacterium RIFCSPHIGHO2_12_FULL_37_14]